MVVVWCGVVRHLDNKLHPIPENNLTINQAHKRYCIKYRQHSIAIAIDTDINKADHHLNKAQSTLAV